MVKVTDMETLKVTEMTDGEFCARIGRLLNEDEVDALHAGDVVCVDTGDSVIDCEVV